MRKDAYEAFLRMTPRQLELATQDSDWAERFFADRYDIRIAPDPDSRVDLGRSWAGIDDLAKQAGVPFSTQGHGSVLADFEHVFLSGWTVVEVAQAAAVLEATPFDVLAVHHDERDMERRKVYRYRDASGAHAIETLRRDYDALRGFFITVAAAGDAVMQFSG